MPVVLDNGPGDRVGLYLYTGSAWVKALADASGHLQVDVLTNALPTGAATLAEQQTQTTALQLIDDLRNALHSVATDRLRISEPRERSPLQVVGGYGANNVAPHAATSRWSYTVPGNRKAIVGTLFLNQLRDGTTGAPALSRAYIMFTPSGASAVRIASTGQVGGTLGVLDSVYMAQSIMMLAGDKLEGFTVDISTGGTYSWVTAFSATEFDA